MSSSIRSWPAESNRANARAAGPAESAPEGHFARAAGVRRSQAPLNRSRAAHSIAAASASAGVPR